MKNSTVIDLKFFLLISCCLLFIFSSATAFGKQTSKKVEANNTTSNKKASPKKIESKSVISRQKLKTSTVVSAKTTHKKSNPNQSKKVSASKLSSKHSGNKKSSKLAASNKKSASTTVANNFKDIRPIPFQFSPFDYSEEQLQFEMKEYLGIPYRTGGTSLKGMDCSGFARTIYASLFGIELPHNSAAQFHFPKLQRIDEDELQTGDLLFFSQRKRINHVGVYLGDGNFIHATNGHGITISSLDDQHWKSRMVGTKRPMTFDKSGVDALHLEGGFDIQLNTNGHLKSFTRDDFRPVNDYTDFRSPNAYRDTNPEVYNFNDGHQYAYEVGYEHHLLNNAFNVTVSAVREKLDKATAWNIYDRNMYPLWSLFNLTGRDTTSTVRHGFKLAGEIDPLEGLIITPSLVYFNYDQNPQTKEMLEVPKRIIGLNTQIYPKACPWSVSMAMHYADQMDMMDSLFKTSDLFNTLDMSLKLGFYFSDNLEFSITGKHDFYPLPSRAEILSVSDTSINSDFLFKLDMKY